MVDDPAQLGVSLRNAQVLVRLVPALKLGPHVDLEVRPPLVVDEAACVEPGLEVGVLQEALLSTDIADDPAQLGVTDWNAQVLLCLVPALKLGPDL